MRNSVVLLFIVFSFHLSASDAVNLFDLKSYDPVKNGLKDFTCEVRLEGITEKIKKQFAAITPKGEVYYKLYWVYPGKVDFKVMGLPNGFRELKMNLKNLVVNRLDYLVPQPLTKKLRSYRLTDKRNSSGVKVTGIDPTNNLTVSKVELSFDKEERLKKFKSFSPLGFRESNFNYVKKSWSKNKWVLEKVMAKMIQGPQVTEIETNIDFKNVVGYGFPEEIEIETRQYVVSPEDNEKKNERTGETKLTFSNYKINSGEAIKYFRN